MIFLALYLFGYALPKLVVASLQIAHIRRTLRLSPVLLTGDLYRKAGHYALAKESLQIVKTLLDSLLVCALVWWGMAEQSFGLWGDALFVVSVCTAVSLAHLPLEMYATLVLDRRYGFFQGTTRLFWSDTAKNLFLNIVLGILACIVVLALLSFSLWWLWACLFFWILLLVANFVYPVWIAPFFNHFTPLENNEQAEQIHALLARVGFVASGIFIMDAGKRDSRLNAYFGGLGKVKRVVLFDTLLAKTTTAQLLAILGHELGHFKHHDIYKSLLFAMCAIAVIFFAASQIPESFYAPILPVAPNIILILFFCAEIVGFWAMPLLGMISRHNEYAADAFGAELQGAENLASALLVLAKENRSFPHAHPLQIFFYHTHPPLLQRLLALGMPQSALVCDESHSL